jgi:hypothetical protein
MTPLTAIGELVGQAFDKIVEGIIVFLIFI